MRTLAVLFLAVLLLASSGCGTLFYSERRHQPHSSKLDPNILIPDGVGPLFYEHDGTAKGAVAESGD